jgi:hypothetical protein
MLVKQLQGRIVAVFYYNRALHLNSLVCYQTASFLTRVVSIANNDKVLNCFAPFVVGFII